MLPWTAVLFSALFALVFGGTHYDLEDDQSSLHERKTTCQVRTKRQVEYTTPAATESLSNNTQNPENQNQQFLYSKQDETSTLHFDYDKHDTTPQYNNDYYYRHRPPPPPPSPWLHPRSWDGYYGYYRRPPPPRFRPPYDGRHPQYPDYFGPPRHGPPPPPWYRDYRSGPPPGRHWPPPPHHGPPPDHHRPPHHGPSRNYHSPPPHGRPPPPPSYYNNSPYSGGYGPSGGRVLPGRHGPPGEREPPEGRGSPGGHVPPGEQGPPGQQGTSFDSTVQLDSRVQPVAFSNLQDGSSSSQSAENAQIIKNLKLILGKTNESSNMNLPPVINTGENHMGGEALSGLDVNLPPHHPPTTPSPHPNLFQVVPVTPES